MYTYIHAVAQRLVERKLVACEHTLRNKYGY